MRSHEQSGAWIIKGKSVKKHALWFGTHNAEKDEEERQEDSLLDFWIVFTPKYVRLSQVWPGHC